MSSSDNTASSSTTASTQSSVAGLIVVALLWGATNPFIKAGSRGLDHVSQTHRDASPLARTCAEWKFLLTRWQYVLPLALNLCGSAVYYRSLGSADLSVAVPVTSALTFVMTALAGMALGEKTAGGGGSVRGIIGMILVGLGVMLCIA